MEAFFWWTDEQKKLAAGVKEFVDELMPRAKEGQSTRILPVVPIKGKARRYFLAKKRSYKNFDF
jgi:hypothetical protein